MKRINKFLKQTLEFVEPYDGVDDFVSVADFDKAEKLGLTDANIGTYLGELDNLGLVKITYSGVGQDQTLSVHLSSMARAYKSERRYTVAKSIGKVFIQLLAGASGGVIVYLLTTIGS